MSGRLERAWCDVEPDVNGEVFGFNIYMKPKPGETKGELLGWMNARTLHNLPLTAEFMLTLFNKNKHAILLRLEEIYLASYKEAQA